MDINNPASPTERNLQSPEYWAASDTRTCADEVLSRCDDYWRFCASRGWFTLWRRLYYVYNPNRYTLGQTIQSGESLEYRTIKVNHFRNLLEHIQTISITDRPAWQPQSVNGDSRSQKQCLIAEGVLDYYMREKRVERHLKDATRNALLFTEGFVMETWEPTAGDAIAQDPESGETRHQGDIRYQTLEPVDVVRDPNLKAFHQRNWLVVRTYENKYDLAARYPEYADEITSQVSGINATNHYLGGQFMDRSNASDQIPVLTFFHTKTASCPEGRQMTMMADGTVLSDGILLYSRMPVHRIAPADQVGSPMGMSVSVELLPLQEMIDSHYTAILSINENYGIPKILLPIGSQVSADAVSAGFQTISYNAQSGKPEVMVMPSVPETLFKTLQGLQQEMETISGVNSVSRGNPEASLKSGSALALVQSMAIQFNAPLQNSYIALLEDVGTATIEILKDYADAPRIIQIAGKRNRGMVQQAFSGRDIDSISRVQVQVGNPLAKTVSGRLAIAQDLLSNGIIKTPDEYLMVLETGTLEPLTQGATAELLNLQSENELLGEGTQVPVLFTDNHVLHIQEHSALASDPVVRTNPAQFQVIAEHIMEHMSQLTDPTYQNYRLLMNQPNLPAQGQMAPAQPQPQPQPQMSGQPGAPEQVLAGQVSAPMGDRSVVDKANSVQMPNPPRNPLSGERTPLPGSQ